VDAIAGGLLSPHEVVVVDSSSPERSSPLESRYRAAPFALRRLRTPRTSVSRARNLGAADARGDWLAFTDDDCLPSPEWLSELTRSVLERSADGATGSVLPLPDDRPGRVPVSSRADPVGRVFAPGSSRPPWEIGTGGNILLSRAAFERVGGFDVRFGPGARYPAAEDVDLLDRVVHAGATVVYEPRGRVFHQMKTAAERSARRYPYGYGLGAMVVLRDGGSLPLASAYYRMQVRSLGRALRQRSPRGVVDSVLAGAGFGLGACRALIDSRTGSGRDSRPGS
jgi:GT2 family glycosyltransferase